MQINVNSNENLANNTSNLSSAEILVVIPARYGSHRLPGKPLKKIAGIPMLGRVIAQARQALVDIPNARLLVATDDPRIVSYADLIQVPVCLTSVACTSGSDRVHQAIQNLSKPPEIIVNLQGDLMIMPDHYLRALIMAMQADLNCVVGTPVVQLSWEALGQLELSKKKTPFSGTTVILNKNKEAIWFSKQLIPAIRNRDLLEKTTPMSPVFKHVGLYAYRYSALEKFVTLPPGQYEQLESLEQLRFLENQIPIQCVPVPAVTDCLGVDSIEDLKRVEAVILSQGDALDPKNLSSKID